MKFAFVRISHVVTGVLLATTLTMAMRKTAKLLNALQKVVLPRIESDIRAIVDGIEEDERDEAVRRKVIVGVRHAIV